MNTKTKLALAAVLFSAIALPAFAGDQDSATLLATSGRIIEPASVTATAYASAMWSARRHVPAHWSMSTIDFQAQGSR